MTVTRYAESLRGGAGKPLLEDLQKRITDVATEAGFEFISHFDRVFRSFVGTSPHAYRATVHVHASTSRERRPKH